MGLETLWPKFLICLMCLRTSRIMRIAYKSTVIYLIIFWVKCKYTARSCRQMFCWSHFVHQICSNTVTIETKTVKCEVIIDHMLVLASTAYWITYIVACHNLLLYATLNNLWGNYMLYIVSIDTINKQLHQSYECTNRVVKGCPNPEQCCPEDKLKWGRETSK